MPHVATMGTSSCATISIGWFKGDTIAENEAFKNEGTVPETEGMEVKEFYNDVLYPVSQPLGRSRNLPFRKLMQDIDACALKTKLVMVTLNHSQYMQKSRYWHKELTEVGFKLITKTKNSIGSVNYVYMRNPSEVAIEEGEA